MARNENLARKRKMKRKGKDAIFLKGRNENDMVKFKNGQEKGQDLIMERNVRYWLSNEKGYTSNTLGKNGKKGKKGKWKENTRQLHQIPALYLEYVLADAW